MKPASLPRILFVCHANSLRSQLAEALARHRFSSRALYASAGIRPASHIDTRLIQFLSAHGVPVQDHSCKNISDLSIKEKSTFNYVVNLTDERNLVSQRDFGDTTQILHWPLSPPSSPDEFEFCANFIQANLVALFQSRSH